jgi:hypothetical protein
MDTKDYNWSFIISTVEFPEWLWSTESSDWGDQILTKCLEKKPSNQGREPTITSLHMSMTMGLEIKPEPECQSRVLPSKQYDYVIQNMNTSCSNFWLKSITLITVRID